MPRMEKTDWILKSWYKNISFKNKSKAIEKMKQTRTKEKEKGRKKLKKMWKKKEKKI